MFFFFKQKTAYELRISDWSSDVCSSDLRSAERRRLGHRVPAADPDPLLLHPDAGGDRLYGPRRLPDGRADGAGGPVGAGLHPAAVLLRLPGAGAHGDAHHPGPAGPADPPIDRAPLYLTRPPDRQSAGL